MVFFVAAGTDQDTEVMMMVIVDHLQKGSIWFNHMSALKFKIVSGRQGKHTNVITEAGDSQVQGFYLQRGTVCEVLESSFHSPGLHPVKFLWFSCRYSRNSNIKLISYLIKL